MSAETLEEACACEEGLLTPTNDQMKRLILKWMCDNAVIEGGGEGAGQLEFASMGSLADFDLSTTTGAYASIGTVPANAYSVIFQNDSDGPIYLSSDGIADGVYLEAGASGVPSIFKLEGAVMPVGGQEFFVKHAGAAPTGTLRVSYSVAA